jgi:LysM repeat protein
VRRTGNRPGAIRGVAMGPTRWLGQVVIGTAIVLLAAACVRVDDAPTPTPNDILVVVTPTPGTPTVTTPTPILVERRYVVREGDSLSAIATRFGITEQALQRANNLTDPNAIFIGQELIIPPPEP